MVKIIKPGNKNSWLLLYAYDYLHVDKIQYSINKHNTKMLNLATRFFPLQKLTTADEYWFVADRNSLEAFKNALIRN